MIERTVLVYESVRMPDGGQWRKIHSKWREACMERGAWLAETLGDSTFERQMYGADSAMLYRDDWLAFIADLEQVAGPTDPQHSLSWISAYQGPGYESWVIHGFETKRFFDPKTNEPFKASRSYAKHYVAIDDPVIALHFKLWQS